MEPALRDYIDKKLDDLNKKVDERHESNSKNMNQYVSDINTELGKLRLEVNNACLVFKSDQQSNINSLGSFKETVDRFNRILSGPNGDQGVLHDMHRFRMVEPEFMKIKDLEKKVENLIKSEEIREKKLEQVWGWIYGIIATIIAAILIAIITKYFVK